ncbi:[FeFe] hydrogenase H-cluster radical SAM maturase HydE [Treponema sp.]|uniref:[FeFe] hydrogenase H-cluster radical SAM maturase HydE n=1 Tax=Treponema sp. TaxID=166 RepID=UPI003890D759
MEVVELIDKLRISQDLSIQEYEFIISIAKEKHIEYASFKADEVRKSIYGNRVFIRGLIEISNICKNNCLYCGIRRDNKNAIRYRLSPEEILQCCRKGHELGFRTFVLQGGEDPFFTDEILCKTIEGIKKEFPDCAVTLSLGERTSESYGKLKQAGADRYLLRHETATEEHYRKLHPSEMSFTNRMECLRNLKEMGYQIGAGFMVGSPFQTERNLAADLHFIQSLKPQMCGLGPFIPHKDTEFNNHPAGTLNQTLLCLSLVRLANPKILLPATTALATICSEGIALGMKAGANVVMPNLTPVSVRNNYSLYDRKSSNGNQAAEKLEFLKQQMNSIGYEVVIDRGDSLQG